MSTNMTESEVSEILDQDLDSLSPEDLASSENGQGITTRDDLCEELDVKWSPDGAISPTDIVGSFANWQGSMQCDFCGDGCKYPCPKVASKYN